MPDRPEHAPTVPPRATTLRMQGLANALTRTLLATPLLARVVGRRLVTLYVVGRRTGRRLTIPVAYTRDGDALLVGTPFAWGRNLHSGEPLEVRFQGRRATADVEVFTAEADVVRLYAVMARDNPQFASFNRIARTPTGEPDQQDLHLAWAAGARAFRITVR